ncbi:MULTISPECIES: metallophosphoesterase family protein [Nocardioides]|uniref:Metallophosphoesterase n=1 Tax=Nocardioides vastitatis TaxID=2568655 RepID=A0ABW0ZBT9_9ACTN|nr:metallophosphoesterase [Nocardioides sp.]THI98223.1 metallophosphoesterase family protein [Nocardioides sp.]
MSSFRLLRVLAWFGAWLVVSTCAASLIFVGSERTIVVASHDATVSPDLSGNVVVRTGPVLPDLRISSGSEIGVEVELGKADTDSMQVLTARYAAIASQPRGQVAVVGRAVRTMALAAIVQGAALGAVPLLIWFAVGGDRRRDLVRRLRTRSGLLGAAVVLVVLTGIVVPLGWGRSESAAERWTPLGEFLGPSLRLPPEAEGVEVLADATTAQTRRLVASAVSSYRQGLEFYSRAEQDAAGLELREPEEDETVVLLVSDRHDNIGMDSVARAIADAGGATAIFNAGDDTSTGERWEAFSLDSVAEAFEDYDGRWAVAGNHDHGSFVSEYLGELGWTYLDGSVVDGPGGSRLLGVDDPRSSGLGNWRDETGLTSKEVGERLTEAACQADEDGERVNTILVHDADFGAGALARGCVDLVVGGHVHVTTGPDPGVGENGSTGYTYTTGTTGGAAYAIAIGTKLRRAAAVALITYRDGRPVGIQSVTLQTNGRYDVDEWVELTY